MREGKAIQGNLETKSGIALGVLLFYAVVELSDCQRLVPECRRTLVREWERPKRGGAHVKTLGEGMCFSISRLQGPNVVTVVE